MLCPSCRASNSPSAARCRKCGEPLARRRRRSRAEEDDDYDDDDDDEGDAVDEVVSTVIPYKNGRALLAYYIGIFGLVPGLGFFLGPTAAVMGLLGMRYARDHPRAKGTGHAMAGIILGALETLLNWGAVIAFIIIMLFAK